MPNFQQKDTADAQPVVIPMTDRDSMEFDQSELQDIDSSARKARDQILDNSMSNDMVLHTNTSQSEDRCEIISMATVGQQPALSSAESTGPL